MSFADEINEAILASQRVTGALIAARVGAEAANPLSLVGVSNALDEAAKLGRHLGRAAEMVSAAQPANDREVAHG